MTLDMLTPEPTSHSPHDPERHPVVISAPHLSAAAIKSSPGDAVVVEGWEFLIIADLRPGRHTIVTMAAGFVFVLGEAGWGEGEMFKAHK